MYLPFSKVYFPWLSCYDCTWWSGFLHFWCKFSNGRQGRFFDVSVWDEYTLVIRESSKREKYSEVFYICCGSVWPAIGWHPNIILSQFVWTNSQSNLTSTLSDFWRNQCLWDGDLGGGGCSKSPPGHLNLIWNSPMSSEWMCWQYNWRQSDLSPLKPQCLYTEPAVYRGLDDDVRLCVIPGPYTPYTPYTWFSLRPADDNVTFVRSFL